MRDCTRNKFMLCNICIRPGVYVDRVLDPADGDGSGHGYVVTTKRKKQKPQGSEVFMSANVTAAAADKNNNDLPSRPRRRSLSRVFKAVMFGSTLTRRILRRKAFNHKVRTTEKPFPSPTGTGRDVEGFESDDPRGLSLSLQSYSKCTDYTTEMYSDSSSDSSSGLTTHGTSTEQEQDPIPGSAQKEPEKLTTAFKRLNHRAVCVILTVVGVTVAWGKACAILFTSIWLYSMFFQRVAARSRIYRGLSRQIST